MFRSASKFVVAGVVVALLCVGVTRPVHAGDPHCAEPTDVTAHPRFVTQSGQTVHCTAAFKGWKEETRFGAAVGLTGTVYTPSEIVVPAHQTKAEFDITINTAPTAEPRHLIITLYETAPRRGFDGLSRNFPDRITIRADKVVKAEAKLADLPNQPTTVKGKVNKALTQAKNVLIGDSSESAPRALEAGPHVADTPGQPILFRLGVFRSEFATTMTLSASPAGYVTIPAQVVVPANAYKVEFQGTRTDKQGEADIMITVGGCRKSYPVDFPKVLKCVDAKKKKK